jgi:hypothetical protein
MVVNGGTPDDGKNTDGWGNLDAQTGKLTARVMRDEEIEYCRALNAATSC